MKENQKDSKSERTREDKGNAPMKENQSSHGGSQKSSESDRDMNSKSKSKSDKNTGKKS